MRRRRRVPDPAPGRPAHRAPPALSRNRRTPSDTTGDLRTAPHARNGPAARESSRAAAMPGTTPGTPDSSRPL
ncbi:hypothetical protein AMK11_11795 [Streptomyces sp. CB02414]|nr:hypothetical protein AMK11_11795 [Streptomyces sp. CB02414]